MGADLERRHLTRRGNVYMPLGLLKKRSTFPLLFSEDDRNYHFYFLVEAASNVFQGPLGDRCGETEDGNFNRSMKFDNDQPALPKPGIILIALRLQLDSYSSKLFIECILCAQGCRDVKNTIVSINLI